jgi:hypothetical protein
LHAAAFVEEALGDDRVRGRYGAERGQRAADVVEDLFGAADVDVRLVHEPAHRVRRLGGSSSDFGAQIGNRRRQLGSTRRRFAEPERHGRGRAGGVDHAHASGLDAADAPGTVAELKDITGQALDREVLVHLADHGADRILDDVVVGHLRNRAAAGDRRQARAARGRSRP